MLSVSILPFFHSCSVDSELILYISKYFGDDFQLFCFPVLIIFTAKQQKYFSFIPQNLL